MNKKLSELIKQNRRPNFKVPTANKLFSVNRFGPLVFLLIFTAAGSAFIYSSSAAPVAKPSANVQATMRITPNKQKLSSGDSFTATLWVDSHSEAVNAVQAVVDYPADRLIYISSDSADSKFTIQAETGESQGRITIARGSTTALTGNQLVATISFKATDKTGSATVKLDSSSVLLSSATNKNILGELTGGNYQITN